LTLEFLAVPGFPPLGVLPFPCAGFHGAEEKKLQLSRSKTICIKGGSIGESVVRTLFAKVMLVTETRCHDHARPCLSPLSSK